MVLLACTHTYIFIYIYTLNLSFLSLSLCFAATILKTHAHYDMHNAYLSHLFVCLHKEEQFAFAFWICTGIYYQE